MDPTDEQEELMHELIRGNTELIPAPDHAGPEVDDGTQYLNLHADEEGGTDEEEEENAGEEEENAEVLLTMAPIYIHDLSLYMHRLRLFIMAIISGLRIDEA